MNIKLWMTQNDGTNTYDFWRSKPEFDEGDEVWYAYDSFGQDDIAHSHQEADVPPHLRFSEGGPLAIQHVEVSMHIKAIGDDE